MPAGAFCLLTIHLRRQHQFALPRREVLLGARHVGGQLVGARLERRAPHAGVLQVECVRARVRACVRACVEARARVCCVRADRRASLCARGRPRQQRQQRQRTCPSSYSAALEKQSKKGAAAALHCLGTRGKKPGSRSASAASCAAGVAMTCARRARGWCGGINTRKHEDECSESRRDFVH